MALSVVEDPSAMLVEEFVLVAVIVMVGALLSITIFLFAPNDPVDPGLGSVSVAALPEASLMVPPFSVRADVDL